ncbi:hypothetical protein [Winogradskyella sediminis]|uniref:hypothetical protein n=1 Tax=Winogradskyella sediminis TaxID=1382466 RepID=UPI003AA9D0E8
MAKQRGIVFFEGTLGGINFYYRKGVPTARRAGGGFNAKAIKTSASMVRVRESNSEFALCSKVNKHFKQAFAVFLVGYKDGTLHSRLMRLFLQLKDLDPSSERGKRKVGLGFNTADGKQLFSSFNVTPERIPFLQCDYGFDFNRLTFNVSNYTVNSGHFPEGSDYMEMVVGLVRFNFNSLEYSQVIANPLIVERDFDGTAFSVSVGAVPEGEGVLIAAVRIAFYQTVNGKGYMLSGGFGVRCFTN